VSWIDIVVAVIAVSAALRGRSTGAFRQLGSVIGFITGFVLGILLAPSLAKHVTSYHWRPIVAIGLVIVVALFGASIGRAIGSIARHELRTLKLGTIDSVAGAVIGLAGALISCWLLAGLIVATSWSPITSAVQNSGLLTVMNAVMPPVPSVEAKVQALFRTADFPSVFAGIISPTLAHVSLATISQANQAAGNETAVVKVLANNACGSDNEGTAFVVAQNEVVTNAHVVAGAKSLSVDGRPARVLVFDPRLDLAVLQVTTGSLAVLQLATGSVAKGAPAAVVGYPKDSNLTLSAAGVEGTITAQGRDIYNNQLVTRSLIVVSVSVQPGNSGSPLFVAGNVAGVIFSRSTDDSQTAYAIPASAVTSELAKVKPGRTVSTDACVAG
jgi:uncharacterized membrane protein required for colicin V production